MSNLSFEEIKSEFDCLSKELDEIIIDKIENVYITNGEISDDDDDDVASWTEQPWGLKTDRFARACS